MALLKINPPNSAISELISKMQSSKLNKYCLMVGLDISNACDHANWEHTINNLKSSNIKNSYINAVIELLYNKEIQFKTSNGILKKMVNSGFQQGSFS